MKKLIILVIIGVAGYYGYQYYGYQYFMDSASSETSTNYSLLLPEECQSAGKNLEDAVARHEVSNTINGFRKTLRTCLRKTDYTESQIDEACDKIIGRRW